MTLSLDTTAAVDLLRGHLPEVRRRFEQQQRQGAEIVVSSIVLYELTYGVGRSERPQLRMRELDALLSRLPVVAFEGADAMTASKLRLQLEPMGSIIAQPDLFIAAQALNRGWIVITSNLRHFMRTKVPLIDWRTSAEIVEFPQTISGATGADEE